MINIFRKLFGPAELQGHQHFSKTVPLHTKERIDKHSDICFLQWNLQDQKLNASAGALTLLGFPEGIQPSFTALKDICHPEDVRQVGRMVDAILFKKNFPDFYCRIITPSHNIKHIFITGEIFFDDNSQSIARRANESHQL